MFFLNEKFVHLHSIYIFKLKTNISFDQTIKNLILLCISLCVLITYDRLEVKVQKTVILYRAVLLHEN